ncbi:replication protein [Rhodococcus rhodochrous]|uniref:replication protein n=1 Tax=Rhodococcus rhodochrous TaxID=1829 RepID=UPI001E4C7C9B|nr:replication protein [Rhodococcus rhodochrous]MCB8911075.1 replication protein [Rhodococcus rhodochrous]
MGVTEMSGGIRRGPRQADQFTILQNAVLNDERLSFRARGILVFLLSKPADWRTRSESIAAMSPREGREAIRTAMRELEQYGYLVREKYQDERGRWHTIQTIYEVPVTSEDPSPEPTPRKSGSGEANVGSPGALTKNRAQRTETNNNTRRAATSRVRMLGTDVLLSESAAAEVERTEQGYAALIDACAAAGLTATFDHVKPAQKSLILDLIDTHGVPALVDRAVALHREDNPTVYAQGWIRGWSSMPRTRTPDHYRDYRNRCTACEGSGFVLNDQDLAVRCACRVPAAA